MRVSKPAENFSDRSQDEIYPGNNGASRKGTIFFGKIIAYFSLLAICVILFAPLISSLSLEGSDYKLHLKWASEMEASHTLNLPHPLYHILVILAKNMLAIDYVQSSIIVVVLSIFFLAALNYKMLAGRTSLSVTILLSICLLIVTPIQLLYFVDRHLYLGYIGISIYHSPTMLLLKPLSLLVFGYALKLVCNQSKNEWSGGLALALSLFFCGISKPNFLIVILPAFLAFLFTVKNLRFMLGRAYIYIWFFLPIFTVLGLQFFQTFVLQDISKVSNDSENHIAIMPFETVSHYSGFLLLKLLLSIAFPLVVLLLYPRRFIKDEAVILSGYCLFVGAILMYFFAESGSRIYHGNFWWSGQVGLYLMFLCSVAFLLKNMKELTANKAERIKYLLCFVVFFLHAAFGVFFYRQEFLFFSKFW